MQLNKSTVVPYLKSYTAYERIYKKRYALLSNKTELNKFMTSLSDDYIKENLLLIPEKLTTRFRQENDLIIQNETMTLIYTQPDILIEKHPRYISEFWHNHAYFEVLYMYDGTCINRFEDSSFEMHTGDVCIVAPRINHSIGIFDDSILINIQIKPQIFYHSLYYLLKIPSSNALSVFFARALNEEKYNPYILFTMPKNATLKEHIENAAIEYFNQQEYASDFVISYIRLFFLTCLRIRGKEVFLAKVTKNNLKKMGSILEYIQKNYQNVTLRELAVKFHYTVPYMSKLIKSYTGSTFVHLIQELRLEYAAHLLISGTKSISDIAYASGYESNEHFIRIFHHKYKMSPLQYRKKNTV